MTAPTIHPHHHVDPYYVLEADDPSSSIERPEQILKGSWSKLRDRLDQARIALRDLGLDELIAPVADGIRQLEAAAASAASATDDEQAIDWRRTVNAYGKVLGETTAGVRAALSRAVLPKLHATGADKQTLTAEVEMTLSKATDARDAARRVERLIAEDGADSQTAALLASTWGQRWGEAHDLPGLADYATDAITREVANSGNPDQVRAAKALAAFDSHDVPAVASTASRLAAMQGGAESPLQSSHT